MLTATLVSALLLASPAPALRVEISSPKTRLSIFEPVKITVRLTALQPVAMPGVDTRGYTMGYPVLETWIDYGQGYRRYADYDAVGGIGCGVAGARLPLQVGDRIVKTLVLGYGVPAFPTPGRFLLRVVVRLPEKVELGESNVITFDVVAPQGDDAVLVQRIRDRPWVLQGGAYGAVADYAALAAQFPASPYLHWGKQGIAVEKSTRIGNGQYPDTDDRFADDGRGHPLTPQLFRELADKLRDSNWGQFDEERLQLAAENLERAVAADRALRNRPPAASDFDEAKTVWREIVERFPGSEAAEAAKSRVH